MRFRPLVSGLPKVAAEPYRFPGRLNLTISYCLYFFERKGEGWCRSYFQKVKIKMETELSGSLREFARNNLRFWVKELGG